MAFVEDTIVEILEDATGLVTLAYDVKSVGNNRYEIDGTTFVVSKVFGDILIQEYGTQLYLDVKQRRAFQIAGGREVGLTSYEAFGVYPQNRRSVRNWLRKGLAVAMYLSIMNEVLGGNHETL